MRGFTASSMKHLIIPTPSLVSPVPTNAEDFQSVVQEIVPTLWWQRARLRGQGTQKGRNGEFINTWPQGWVSPRSDTQLPSHDSSVSSQTLLFSRPSLDFYLRTLSLLIFKALSLDNPSEQMDLPTAHLWKLIQDLTSKVRPWSDKKRLYLPTLFIHSSMFLTNYFLVWNIPFTCCILWCAEGIKEQSGCRIPPSYLYILNA